MRSIPIASLALALSTPAAAQLDVSGMAEMRARSIGPAGMSGRVAAIDVALSDPNVIYVGAATGGLWKSADGGITWTPVFDDQPTSSIGAVAVFQPNPDIVWVGTGEGNPRNSAGVGRGVFRSMDGGRTWTALGLGRSERIHRLVLHPTDPDVAFAAAMGPSWSDGEERGVFRTTDGGRTWDRVLFVNPRTGASDLVMDPRNPNKLFAGMWEHRRWPWFFESGGEGSGLYVTHDAGDTWRRFTPQDGLPAGSLGRIGLAVAAGDPRVVYALVEAERSALLRSGDGGATWSTIRSGPGTAPRPFYYADIRVDPTNENRLYNLHSQITVSEDQGRTFRTVVPSAKIHGDVQELWIDPTDGARLIMGNDGGAAISYDRGATWRFVSNLPLAQFYHINVDMDTPYNVYGGLQDNGSWFGPSASWYDGPIRNYYWTRVGSGDGFASLADFSDGRYGYSMSQQGNLRRFDRVTGERKDIQPVHPDGTRLRFNWNAGLNVDPFDSSVVYLGSQFVHRSRDNGHSWEIISPDLTTDDPEKQRSRESGGITRDASGAENHTTILTIAPSPVSRGVIWVGTDDGNVQVTRDGGATWANVTGRIPDVPDHTWVPHIEPSKFDGAAAFVVLDDHRRGDWTPYVFRTADAGRSWTSIATDEIDGFVHVLEQDPVEPDLLFLGTEFGLYVSVDGGSRWSRWTHGLPTAPYRALMVHPRDHDLVIGTHGRAVYVLDDVRPLRALAREPDALRAPLRLFEIPPAAQHTRAESMTVGFRSTGDAMFAGENRPYGALITYAVGDASEAPVVVEVLDRDGAVVRTMDGPATAGLHRIAWDLRRNGFRSPGGRDDDAGSGPEVLPGTYTVRVTSGDHVAEAPVGVTPDPRSTVSPDARRQKLAALLAVGRRTELAAEALDRARTAHEAVETAIEYLHRRDGEEAADLAAGGVRLRDRLDHVIGTVVAGSQDGGLTDRSALLGNRLRGLYGSLESSWDAPTEAQERAGAQIDAALREMLETLNRLLEDELPAFRAGTASLGLAIVPDVAPLAWEWTPAR